MVGAWRLISFSYTFVDTENVWTYSGQPPMATWFYPNPAESCSCLVRAISHPLRTDVYKRQTFVYPILSKWSADYSGKAGININYQSIGSGGGLAQIKAATVDFGASDAPMKPAELQKFGMGQFPLVIGGIAPVVNIDGVQAGQMRFTGPLLADIYLGKIKNWNDPAIAKLNPDLKLPDAAIAVVHRSDGSGTTFNPSRRQKRILANSTDASRKA